MHLMLVAMQLNNTNNIWCCHSGTATAIVFMVLS